MRHLLCLGTIAALSCALPTIAQADEAVTTCSRVEANNERTLCHELVVPASSALVWELISTAEGWRTWAAPVVQLQLSAGGSLETSYAVDGHIGDGANIRNRILAFVPERQLIIQIADAPPGFPHEELARELTTAIELEPIDAERTLVRVTMMGYRDAPGFDALYAFFERGNAFTLEKLGERVVSGPIDWRSESIPPGGQP